MLKRSNLRWWIIGLVTLGTILNYFARSTLSNMAHTCATGAFSLAIFLSLLGSKDAVARRAMAEI